MRDPCILRSFAPTHPCLLAQDDGAHTPSASTAKRLDYTTPMALFPKMMQQIGDELVVVWSDGHESYYTAEALRKNCPCAYCEGEGDLFGRVVKGPPVKLTPESFQLANAEQIGNYGIQMNFADGHSWGIWTFDRLRSVCGCERCRAGK